jgi:hypothetical protein
MDLQKTDRDRMFGHHLIFGVQTPKAESTYDSHYRIVQSTEPESTTIDTFKLNELHLSTRINYIQDCWSKSNCIHHTFDRHDNPSRHTPKYNAGKKKCILSPSEIAKTQDYYD